MANIFRVVKDKNYTIVNNDYLKNKNLRVDSIGLLTIILSLPSDFNITMKGIISLTHQKANYRAIKVMIDNLKENGYSYRYSRIGENYDDYDEKYYESENEEEQDLIYPSIIREFDDDYIFQELEYQSNLKKDDIEL